MLKSFDIRVQSRYSANWYDTFIVDSVHGVVYFHQCDARRNGQIARYMKITFHNNGSHTIEARSANNTRYEQFSTTQCIKLALRLLEEARSEARQVASVASSHEADNKVSKPQSDSLFLGAVFGILTLMIVYFGIMLDPEEYLTATRVFLGVVCGLLTVGFFHNAYIEMTGKDEQ